jgi:hypothetical protein
VQTLEISLPYFAVKAHKTLRLDSRQWPDGTPLRKSEVLPFLNTPPRQQEKKFCLYEAQFSAVVTIIPGTSDAVYTVCGFNDTYFDPRSRLQRYARIGKAQQWRPDPLAFGLRDANLPIQVPDEYFLDIVEIGINHVQKESRFIVQTLQQYRQKKCVLSIQVLVLCQINEAHPLYPC